MGPFRAHSGYFCYEVFPTLGNFTLPMRTVRRLRLRYLLFTSTPDVLPLSLSHHVETGQPHQKRTTRLPIIKRGVVPFWWSWRESNPRPQRLHYEGITTIL